MWNPEVYMRFGDHRTRPALELAMRARAGGASGLESVPRLIYDLGCGPGNSTEVLARLNPGAQLVGVDSSQEMLAQARRDGPETAEWTLADLASWQPETPADLIYSNATYQWLDGHATLFPALLDHLSSKGTLAIQMPQNFSAPSHVLMRGVASQEPWAEKLTPLLRHDPVASPEAYYDLFCDRCVDVDIWETEYGQVLDGADPVFDWVSGTALRPLMAALSEAEQAAFAEAYKEKLKQAYPRRADGKTLFPFKRIFMVVRV